MGAVSEVLAGERFGGVEPLQNPPLGRRKWRKRNQFRFLRRGNTRRDCVCSMRRGSDSWFKPVRKGNDARGFGPGVVGGAPRLARTSTRRRQAARAQRAETRRRGGWGSGGGHPMRSAKPDPVGGAGPRTVPAGGWVFPVGGGGPVGLSPLVDITGCQGVDPIGGGDAVSGSGKARSSERGAGWRSEHPLPEPDREGGRGSRRRRQGRIPGRGWEGLLGWARCGAPRAGEIQMGRAAGEWGGRPGGPEAGHGRRLQGGHPGLAGWRVPSAMKARVAARPWFHIVRCIALCKGGARRRGWPPAVG